MAILINFDQIKAQIPVSVQQYDQALGQFQRQLKEVSNPSKPSAKNPAHEVMLQRVYQMTQTALNAIIGNVQAQKTLSTTLLDRLSSNSSYQQKSAVLVDAQAGLTDLASAHQPLAEKVDHLQVVILALVSEADIPAAILADCTKWTSPETS